MSQYTTIPKGQITERLRFQPSASIYKVVDRLTFWYQAFVNYQITGDMQKLVRWMVAKAE